MTTRIPEPDIVLQQIIRHLEIVYKVEFMSNELLVEIDEDKIINALSVMAYEYKKAYEDYAGNKHIYPKKIDKIVVKIGDYRFSAKEEFTTVQNAISNGFKKEIKNV